MLRLVPLLLALSWFGSARSRAEDVSRPLLEVVAAGAPHTLSALQRRLRALEMRSSLRLRWSERAALDVREIVSSVVQEPGVFARVWLDLSDPERAVLFIANAGHDRLLVRVVQARGGYGELMHESLTTIVESAVDALLAGGQIGVERSAAVREIEAQTGAPLPPAPAPVSAPLTAPVTATAPGPAPRSPSSPSHSSHLLPTLSAAYRGDVISAGPAFRHGLALALSLSGFFRPRLDLSLGLGAHYFSPFSLADGDTRVREHGGGVRLALGATGQLSRRFSWRAAISGGIDLARVTPGVLADSTLLASGPFLATVPMLGALLSGAVRLSRWLALQIGAGFDLDLSAHHFDLKRTSGRARAITPWRAHPYWLVGLALPLARDGWKP